MNVPYIWRELSKKLKKARVFKPDRIEAHKLHAIYQRKRAYVVFESIGGKREIIAFGALWDTEDPEWFEMGTIWVDQNRTGQGLSLQIFSKLLKLSGNKSCFLVSKNPKIIGIAKDADWITTESWQQTPCTMAIRKNRPMGDGRTLCYHSST